MYRQYGGVWLRRKNELDYGRRFSMELRVGYDLMEREIIVWML